MVAIVAGYLIGSIPFSYILPRVLKGVDIRFTGTRNVGGSNAIRSAGKTVGLIAGILDFLKGFVAAFLILKLTSPGLIRDLALTTPIIGHCYSIFIGFKGGRGIATTLGILLYLTPLIFLVFVAISLIGLALREAALSNFIAILAIPFAGFLYPGTERALLLISIFLIFRRASFAIYDVNESKSFIRSLKNRILFDAPEKVKIRR